MDYTREKAFQARRPSLEPVPELRRCQSPYPDPARHHHRRLKRCIPTRATPGRHAQGRCNVQFAVEHLSHTDAPQARPLDALATTASNQGINVSIAGRTVYI